jgi:hypothetical protein
LIAELVVFVEEEEIERSLYLIAGLVAEEGEIGRS